MDKQNKLSYGFQEISQKSDSNSRAESAPPSVELLTEPKVVENLVNQPVQATQYNATASNDGTNGVNDMYLYDDYNSSISAFNDTDPFAQQNRYAMREIPSMMSGEMEETRNPGLTMKNPMPMNMNENDPDTIISHPIRMNTAEQNDSYYLQSQMMNNPYNNMFDEEIRNSSKSAPVAYREDYFNYPYHHNYDYRPYDRMMNNQMDQGFYNSSMYSNPPYGNMNYPVYPNYHMQPRPRNNHFVPSSPVYSSSSPNPNVSVPTSGNSSNPLNSLSIPPSGLRSHSSSLTPAPTMNTNGSVSGYSHSYRQSISSTGSQSAHNSTTPIPTQTNLGSVNDMEINMGNRAYDMNMMQTSLDMQDIRLDPTMNSMDGSAMNLRSKKQSPSLWTKGSIDNYKGQIFEMSKDQKGCRLLQQCLDEGGNMVVDTIYKEVEGHLVDLMYDSFGNYLFQKLMDNSNDEQRRLALNKVYEYIVKASLDVHGTRSVQKIIQTCRQPDMVELIMNTIRNYIDTLSSNSNGNHVIQRCLQYMPLESKAEIYEQVIQHCYDIATHRHGCCVVQRCLDSSPTPYHDRLLNEIIIHAVQLMQNPFGNYVVQYLIENGQPQESQRLIACVLGNVVLLSSQKYSSNVIEKSLKYSTEELRGKIIMEIANSDQIRALLHQEFANYVIQKALLLGSKEQRLCLLRSIVPYKQDLAKSTGGRHILARLQDFPELNA